MRLRCTRMATRMTGAGVTIAPAETFVPSNILVDAVAGTYAAGFARSGAVQVPDDTGVLRTFATDAPAREYRAGFGWGYVTHQAFTVGQQKPSHDLMHIGWGLTGLTRSSDASSPATSGTSTVFREIAASGPWQTNGQWLGSVAAGSYLTVSVVVGPQTNRVFGIHSNTSGANFDYATGTVTTAFGTVQSAVTELTGGWYRVDVKLLFTGTANNPLVYFKSIGAATTGDPTKGFQLYCINISNSALMGLPLVVTASTQVTTGEATWRNTLAAIGASPVGAMGLSAYSLITAPASSRHMMRVDDNSDVNRLLFYIPTAGASPLALNSVANATVHIDIPAGATPMPGPIGIVGNLTADTGSRTACNGVAMVASTDGAGAASGLTHWAVGGGSGTGFGMPMLVRRAWLHNGNLSAANLIAESLK